MLNAENFGFPDPATQPLDDEGLLAVGGDLQPMRLLAAYANGIFPWFNSDQEQILWWCPNPRGVIAPDQFQPRRSLRKVMNQQRFEIRMDTAFTHVIQACADTYRPGQGGTWITPNMQQAYIELHEQGFAHSVEAWQDDTLVGGLYGVSLGTMFFGESMFSRVSEASKVAFATLCQQLTDWQFDLIDCQMMNPHLQQLGVTELPRQEFLALLRDNNIAATRRGLWH